MNVLRMCLSGKGAAGVAEQDVENAHENQCCPARWERSHEVVFGLQL